MMGEEGLGEKGEGTGKYRLVQNSHRDVKCSLRNITNNIAISMYAARWVLEILGWEHFAKYMTV